MVYPVHGESGDNTFAVSVAKVQTTGVSDELDFQGGKRLIAVRQGETLSGIARKYQTTVSQIVSLNGIHKPDEIKAGQKLWIMTMEAGEPTEASGPNKPIEATVQNRGSVGNLFYLNYIFALALEGSFDQKSLSEKVRGPIETVDFFVNDEESTTVAQPDKESYTILLEPITATPVQSSEESREIASSKVTNSLSIEETSNKISRGSREFTNEDIELLARVIHGEARGEDFEGQVAVGAVVVNRLNDPRFPDTIQGVIYQKGAFTAVSDKQIHLTPDDEAFRAAEAALDGKDPTGGAIYYYNPKTATDRWIKSRPVIKQIGNHTFSI
jgi:N-acetylmuramoyl-L-alanine amidase